VTPVDNSYIGETGQCLEERLKQHKYAIKSGNIKGSALAEHLNICDASYNFNNTEIIARENNKLKRRIKEGFFIKLHEGKTINRKNELGNFPLGWELLFDKLH
jgi:hypothetical protein